MELIGSEAELKLEINDNADYNDNENDNEALSYIPYDILTPSEEIGMSQNEEKSIRCFLMSIIQEMGLILRINQTTVLTAMNIANHFYLKQPFNLYEPIYILCASLFISGKMEENGKKPSDLFSAALYILTEKRGGRDLKEDISIDYSHLKNFSKMKDNIYNAELVILKELSYDFHSFGFHPHCLLLHYIKKISDDSNLLKHSWGFLNDMYRTSLTANYPPNALACSSIFLASRKFYISLPKDIPWWEIYETTIQQIEEIIAETLKLYEYYSQYDLYDVRQVFKRLKYQKERENNKNKNKNENKHHKHKRHQHSHYRHRDHHRSRSRDRHSDTHKHNHSRQDKLSKHKRKLGTSNNKSSTSLSSSSYSSKSLQDDASK